jgi:hypothetical protein
MATRMQQRRGTAEQWTAANPVLAAGEIGFETDTSKFKIGDGVNTWTTLTYFTTIDEALADILDGAPAALDTLNELAAALGNDADFASTITNALANKATIIQKTDEQWVADTDIIPESVLVYNTTTGGFKVGNGVDPYGTLSLIWTATQVLEAVNEAVDAGISAAEEATAQTLNDAIADLLEDSTFTGTIVLPEGTTIGDVSPEEISYLNGVTSSIQSQIDAKLASSTASTTYAPINSPTFTGDVILPGTTTIGTITSEELGYVTNVTSDIQTQLNSKAPTNSPTFTGTVSGVTKEMVGLGNVDNTSDVDKPVSTATQTALNAKASLSGATFTGPVSIEGNLTVTGETSTINATDLSISDPLIYLASSQYTTDSLDVGFLAATGAPGGTEEDHLHSGFFRDVSDGKKWKLVSNVPHPVANTVDVTNATYETLVLGNLEAAGVVFSDGTQTRQGVPSITTITPKTDSYTLSSLSERDTIIEINNSSATTLTIPADGTVNYPVGTTLDIIQTGSGQVTIAGAGGVTVNATPGLKLRTQWSSVTLLKRASNTWLVFGDLSA